MFRRKLKKDFNLSLRALCLCGEKSGFSRRAQNSGVALVMVLGLLTVMVLLAVTFAVSMRTERLAAGNYADTVRARELVQVGLARAMSDLARDLGPTGLYQLDGKVYPNWSVTNSYTNSNGDPRARWLITNGIVRGEATNYVPRALWVAATDADLNNPSNHWLPVESIITNAAGVLLESNLMGRVAYVVLNCSGLLDANYAGGSPRTNGTSPNEIAIGNLDEIGINSNDFISVRASDVRYETLAQLNSSMTNFGKQASNLFVYSRALSGYWNNGVVTQVNLAGTNILARQIPITDALTNIGFSSSDAYTVWHNLIDYVDTNLVWDSPYAVEPVPMINEVVVSNNHTVTEFNSGGFIYYKHTITGAVYIECWYPFVSNADVSFDIRSKVDFTGSIKPDNLPEQSYNIASPVVAGSFYVVRRNFGPNDFTNSSPGNVIFNSQITVSVGVGGGGETVDQLAGSVGLTNETIGVNGEPHSSVASCECLDPRFNYYITNTNLWRHNSWQDTSQATLSNRNQWTINYLNDVSHTGDTNWEMFVANRPLRSVAELGYLVYSTNAPWHTIKLYGPDLHRVLDVFAIDNSSTNDYVVVTNRGMVNPNSRQDDALSVVFADMPVDQYSGDPGGTVLTTNMAREVYSRLANSQAFANGFTNLSDIGRALTNFNSLGSGSVTFDNELKRESLFRNACGLLSVRQNVFTIIIEAQAASNGNIPKNPARQRAVAIVWRDPYTGEMFVRHIKWLGD